MTTATAPNSIDSAIGITDTVQAQNQLSQQRTDTKPDREPEMLPYRGRMFDYQKARNTGVLSALEAEITGLGLKVIPEQDSRKADHLFTERTLRDWLENHYQHLESIVARYCLPETVDPPKPTSPPIDPTEAILLTLAGELKKAAGTIDDQRRRFVVAIVDSPKTYSAQKHAAFLADNSLTLDHVIQDCKLYRAFKIANQARVDGEEIAKQIAALRPDHNKLMAAAQKAKSESSELAPAPGERPSVEFREAQHRALIAQDAFAEVASQMGQLKKQADALELSAKQAFAQPDESSSLAENHRFPLAGIEGVDIDTPQRRREMRMIPKGLVK